MKRIILKTIIASIVVLWLCGMVVLAAEVFRRPPLDPQISLERASKQGRTAASYGVPATANPFIGKDGVGAFYWLEGYLTWKDEDRHPEKRLRRLEQETEKWHRWMEKRNEAIKKDALPPPIPDELKASKEDYEELNKYWQDKAKKAKAEKEDPVDDSKYIDGVKEP